MAEMKKLNLSAIKWNMPQVESEPETPKETVVETTEKVINSATEEKTVIEQKTAVKAIPKISLSSIKTQVQEEPEVVEEIDHHEAVKLSEEEERIKELTSKVTVDLPKTENLEEGAEYFTNYNKEVEEVKQKVEITLETTIEPVKSEGEIVETVEEKEKAPEEKEKFMKKIFSKKKIFPFVVMPTAAIMVLCTGLFVFVQSNGEIPAQPVNILEHSAEEEFPTSDNTTPEQVEIIKNEMEELNRGGYKIQMKTINNPDGTTVYMFNGKEFTDAENLYKAIEERIDFLKVKKLKDFISK